MRIHFIIENVVDNTVDDESLEKVQAVYPQAVLVASEVGGPGWRYVDGALVPPAAPAAPSTQALVDLINTDADAIYAAVLGYRAEEYTAAADQAAAFKTAGYAGDVPDSVSSWATAKGWTNQQATDDILTTSDAWQSARANIRAARLLRREQVRAADGNAAAQETAMAAWRTFRDGVRVQLGLPAV